MERIKGFIKGIGEILKKPVVSILPGYLSFSFVLSFVPLLSLIGLLAYNLSISIDVLRDFITNSFPGETSELLIKFLNRDTIYFDGVLFALLAVSLLSNGMYAVIRISNILYGLSEDTFPLKLKNRIKSVLMAFLMISLIIFMFIVLGWGNSIISIFTKVDSSNSINDGMIYFYNLLKYPVSFFVIYFIMKIIFTLAPNEKIKSRSVSFGALFTTTFFIIVSFIYSKYVTFSHRYDILYGSLSNIIILFIWLYFISLVFILGLSINVYNSKKLKKSLEVI